ncbi:MAG: ankyrin repeat domain-containing protein [Rhodoferax sp.]|nr:ankyrin repeat domain-containing protein [Rhodoferax sp.]
MRFHFKFVAYLILGIGFSIARADTPADLFKAVEIDAPHLVTQALVAGVDPNVRDDKGQVALFVALRGESLQAAEALLAHPGTDVDAANANGETPLMMAALRGQLPWMQRLIERGAAINKSGWTPLHYAASGPSVPAVELLVGRGAVLDARSPNGTTPLMMAARYGAIDAADLLLAKGADPALRNERDLTAADFATAAGREPLAQRLKPR